MGGVEAAASRRLRRSAVSCLGVTTRSRARCHGPPEKRTRPPPHGSGARWDVGIVARGDLGRMPTAKRAISPWLFKYHSALCVLRSRESVVNQRAIVIANVMPLHPGGDCPLRLLDHVAESAVAPIDPKAVARMKRRARSVSDKIARMTPPGVIGPASRTRMCLELIARARACDNGSRSCRPWDA